MKARTSQQHSRPFSISSGSGRTGKLVCKRGSQMVKLATATSIDNFPVLGAIVVDEGKQVRYALGVVEVVVESGLTISNNDKLWLSNTEAGTVTNIAPTTGVMCLLGCAIKESSDGKVLMELNPTVPVVLH